MNLVEGSFWRRHIQRLRAREEASRTNGAKGAVWLSLVGGARSSKTLPIGRLVAVARAHGSSLDMMRTASKSPNVRAARAEAYAMLAEDGWSASRVGRYFKRAPAAIERVLARLSKECSLPIGAALVSQIRLVPARAS